MPGLTGPVPKREAERRRTNTTTESGASNEAQKVTVSHELMEDPYLVKAPSPSEDWHPLAAYVYWAARTSATREFYEPTDWAMLLLTCEQISRGLKPVAKFDAEGNFLGEFEEPITGPVMNGILKAATGLMFMEGDRRKLRLEIEREAGSIAARQAAAPTGDNVIDIRKQRLG